ncbi:hypothetical protein [Rhodopirellula halodulae]|uniref:hypothetical protein n=1 Tax=Rhodopirellula halodulae TaxID=2894198 RepID=UPI001E598F6C|nr:hypothetical protein [Rhodopirellula sp. JC737]MCC9657838.1 hypothetical protein [Rhodopirellula sp. JC737]
MTQLKRHDDSVRPKQCRRTALRRQAQRAFLASLVAGVLTSGLTGCTIMGGLQSKLTRSDCIDDFMVSHRNKVMATKAWLRHAHCYKNHRHMKDLRKGFIDGYIDVATGGSGCTPAVVSPHYWGWKHQSGDGQSAVNAWFEGFPLGVKAAEEDGIAFYNQIRIQTPTRPAHPPMTGSMAPTPAAAPVVTTPTALPPGIQLGEGETLVPGKVTIEDAIDPPKPAKETFEKIVPPVPVQAPATDDPFSMKTLPLDNDDAGPSTSLSDLPAEFSETPVDLVPKETQTPVSTNIAEPTQDEIDSVIEEIFGRPDKSADAEPAVETPAKNQSMQFLFD